MKDYNWNPYPKKWRKPDEYRNAGWNYDPHDQNYYLGKINNFENMDLDERYYTDGSDRYYRNEEIKRDEGLQPYKNKIKDTEPYKNNDFYAQQKQKLFMGATSRERPKNYTRSLEKIKE